MSNELLCVVVNLGEASHVLKIAKENGVQTATISVVHGSGGEHSRLSAFLGLSDERKEIIDMVVDKETAVKVINNIHQKMKMDKPHHGIAFTIPLSMDGADEITAESNNPEDKMYKIINAIVDKGIAEDVIEAAKDAGAKGGTIVNARSAYLNDVHKVFSVEIEPEKEKVFIIVKSELSAAVIEAINNRLNHIGQSGIVYAMTIDEIHGLHE